MRPLAGGRRAWHAGPVLLMALLALGARCGGGDGSGGGGGRTVLRSGDPDCVALFSSFPPGFDLVAGVGDRVVVASDTPAAIVGFDVGSLPLRVPAGWTSLVLPPDSDGDGREEGSLFLPRPRVDDIESIAPDLAIVTTSGYEALLFVDPRGVQRSLRVEVDAGFDAAELPLLPAPGSSALRTGVANFHCLVPPPGATDSRGDPLTDPAVLAPAAWCDPGGAPSFRASFTSGVAFAANRLFVTVSNVGAAASQGSADTQFLPGAVLVYDLDLGASPPRIAPSPQGRVRFTSGFNPTHATAYTTPGGRALVLVTLTGAIGIRPDDPATSEREGGTLRLGPGAVDVIDAVTLELVASVPLGLANPGFREIAIDPSGRLALLGDVADRSLIAIDLAPLDALPARVGAAGPVILDGSGGPRAAIFDAALPLRLPAPPGGAPESLCPGRIESVAFARGGDRAFALDTCHGTLTTIAVDLSGAPAAPLPASRLRIAGSRAVAAPLRADRAGEPQQPGALHVRPALPGGGGPDVLFTIGTPEGELCGLFVDAAR